MHIMLADKLLTECEVAELLGITVCQVRRLVRNQQIPFTRLPTGEVRFSATDLERCIAEWSRWPPTPIVPHHSLPEVF